MQIKHITIHCSATENKQEINAETIRKWHMDKGWSDIGYHAVILTDGTIERGRPIDKQGAHVLHYNKDNLGICLIGGVDHLGDSVMNFTQKQEEQLNLLVVALIANYEVSIHDVKGHRDFSRDLDNNGVITKNEFMKDCPCFDVKHWLATGEMVFEVT